MRNWVADLEPEHFIERHRSPCTPEEAKPWKSGPWSSWFVQTWGVLYPGMPVLAESTLGRICVLPLSSSALAPQGRRPHLAMLVQKASPKGNCRVCKYNHFYRRVEPVSFAIKGQLLQLRPKLPERRVHVAWPPVPCTKDNPCPVVLVAGGADEKTWPDRTKNIDPFWLVQARRLFANWHQCDKACSSQQRSVIVSVELIYGEFWHTDGAAILDDFVLPYLEELFRSTGSGIDPDRIAIVGVSEGARAVVHALLRYPHVFSLGLVLGPREIRRTWPWVKATPMPIGRFCRFRLLIFALGELELKNFKDDLSEPLQRMNPFLDACNASVHVRFHRQTAHMGMLEYPINSWNAAVDAMWRGKWP